MKKIFTSFFSLFMLGAATAQWSPTTFKGEKVRKEANIKAYYSLDISALRSQLANAQEAGKGAKAVEISLPTLNGKVEKFAVYSFPVFAKDLADQYQLGSYVGVGVDDPSKYVRFSLAPNDFQSMIFSDGNYEFVEPANADKTVYGVHPKTQGSKHGFECSTEEPTAAIKQIESLTHKGSTIANQPTDFSKSNDKKYRTMRLAISATSSYVAFTGGTLASALAQINATMTRVNGVFEKDFALHLNIVSYPGIIFTNPATDPYVGPSVNLNLKLQQTLTANVGNANYDIGHVFNAAGNNGNAGCIGCVCIAPASNTSLGKGSAFTQSTSPASDTFDIDFVAHEMGHQLGATHTFAFNLEGAETNVEPGSGSTIMGYAGITGADNDVQAHSDPYFHMLSLFQVNDNLINKTCDVETPISNNPPVIASLPAYTIPKGTPFVLTASATDAENDPMTYTWEQIDNADETIDKYNIGTTDTGASFRSFNPTTSPTRYFPKLESVINGYLDNSNDTWESVPLVARQMNFAVTVRDNNANANQQQSNYNFQTINVGNNGPFKVSNTSQYLYSNVSNNITWDVASTTLAPYNSPNVKIDYSTDNGATWAVLSASTPNDGSEAISMPASLNGQFVALRISSIGNVFYALKKMFVATQVACGTAVSGVYVSNITAFTASVNWAPITGAASYVIRYKKASDNTWQQATSTTNNVNLANLSDASAYEVQVAAVCSGTTGAYSASVNFSTPDIVYCAASSATAANLYINKVQVANINNTSTGSVYTNFTTNPALQVNLVKGTQYPMTITSNVAAYNFAVVFIDYNRNGIFESTERVLNFPVASASSFSNSFTVPTTGVVEGQILRMRVILGFAGSTNAGLSVSPDIVCGTNFNDGEVEDYNVVVTATALATNDITGPKNDIQLYPNPTADILNITKISDKAAYKIYSAAGQLVRQGNISNGQINVSELIKGAYVITIEEKGKDLFTSKFIKK